MSGIQFLLGERQRVELRIAVVASMKEDEIG